MLEPQTVTDPVESVVENDERVVRPASQNREQSGVLDDQVELIAVGDQESAPIGGGVIRFDHHLDPSKIEALVLPGVLVVVAGDEENSGAFPGVLEDPRDHPVVLFRPEPPLAESPHIDHITYKVEAFGSDSLEKRGQLPGPAAVAAQVQVADKD